jgi:excisionase family DNA binding protein
MRLEDQEIEAIAEAVARRLENETRRPAKRLLSLQEAGAYIGRSARAVRALIAARAFPAIEADRRVFIDRQDLDAWIERYKA